MAKPKAPAGSVGNATAAGGLQEPSPCGVVEPKAPGPGLETEEGHAVVNSPWN